VYQTTADNYFAPKTGYNAPTQPFLEGAWPWFHPYFTPNSLCWLCVLLPLRWPRRSATPPPVPATPIKPTRKRATEPTAFVGLTHTPPCALCEPEAGETPPAPLQRPDPMPPTHRRPRSVDTSMHLTGGLVEELKAKGQEEGQHELDKRLAIPQQPKVAMLNQLSRAGRE